MPRVTKLNLRLSSAVERYVQRCENEKMAERTLYTTKMTLARFQRHIAARPGGKRDPDPYVHLITDVMMDDYCYGDGGIAEGVKSVSFNRYRQVLVLFFRYCEDMRWLDDSPMRGTRRARPDKPVSRLLLSADEMLTMLELAANPVERIALSLGMNTGLRGNDIRHLTVFDANLSGGVIQTEIRKTKKLDVKPLTLELEQELRRWFAEYKRLMKVDVLPNDWLLVPSYTAGRPTKLGPPGSKQYSIRPRPTQLHTKPWNFVKRPLEKMGYPTKGEGFHTLRRSSARHLFEMLREQEHGRDHALMIVKDFLNHASTAQTEVYLGLSHERVMRDATLKGQAFLSKELKVVEGSSVPLRVASSA